MGAKRSRREHRPVAPRDYTRGVAPARRQGDEARDGPTRLLLEEVAGRLGPLGGRELEGSTRPPSAGARPAPRSGARGTPGDVWAFPGAESGRSSLSASLREVKRGGATLETQALLERASAAHRLLERGQGDFDPRLLLSYVCWPTDELLEAQERRRKTEWQRKLDRDVKFPRSRDAYEPSTLSRSSQADRKTNAGLPLLVHCGSADGSPQRCRSCLVATASSVPTGVRARAAHCLCSGSNASSGVALLLVVPSAHAVGAAAGSCSRRRNRRRVPGMRADEGRPRGAGTCSPPTRSVWRDSTPRPGAPVGVDSPTR
jgi:hypothetical protein